MKTSLNPYGQVLIAGGNMNNSHRRTWPTLAVGTILALAGGCATPLAYQLQHPAVVQSSGVELAVQHVHHQKGEVVATITVTNLADQALELSRHTQVLVRHDTAQTPGALTEPLSVPALVLVGNVFEGDLSMEVLGADVPDEPIRLEPKSTALVLVTFKASKDIRSLLLDLSLDGRWSSDTGQYMSRVAKGTFEVELTAPTPVVTDKSAFWRNLHYGVWITSDDV